MPKEHSFIYAVESACLRLGVKVDDLLTVMFNESKINPHAVNSLTKATGLIQFMPSTAKGLGTTIEALKLMTATEQMVYVEKYFKPFAGKINSIHDLYAVVFFPVMLGKPNSFILKTASLSASLLAKSNAIFDLNKDSQITKAEFNAFIDNNLLPLAGYDTSLKKNS